MEVQREEQSGLHLNKRRRLSRDYNMEESQSNLNKRLFRALMTDVDLIARAFEAGADVDIQYFFRGNVYCIAVETKNTDIKEQLSKAGAKVDVKDKSGDLVLFKAEWSMNYYYDFETDLMKAGVKVDVKKRKYGENAEEVCGNEVLHRKMQNDNIDIVRELVKAGADVNARPRFRDPVLVSAVMNENIDIIKELVKAGADVNAKYGHGNSVLVSAVRNENIDIVKELVKAGADVNAEDGERNPVLVSAARTKNIDIVKELVKAGADVNAKDCDGDPVLVSAVMDGNTDLVRELLKAGADFIYKMHTDQSIVRLIHLAVAYPNVEILKELVKCGAYINYDDQGEVSALHLVMVETNTDILRKVYDDEKNCNARGKYNRTFLHYAASLGSHQQIKDVLSLSDINADLKDYFGNSPLHCAVQIGNLETIRALITAGCDREAVDFSGRTVVHLAAIYGQSDLVDLFIDECSLNTLKLDNMQRNCLHHAVIFRREDFVRTLVQRNADAFKEYDKKDSSGKTPSDYLQSCEKNSLISKYLHGESAGIQTIPLKNIQTYAPDISNAISINLSKISKEPSIGSVATITGHDNELFVDYVKNEVQRVIREAVPVNQYGEAGRVVGCGSSFEGTKTGMPDEFDFLVKLDSYPLYMSEHEGYGNMNRDPLTGSYGLWLWNLLMSFWSDCQTKGRTSHSDGQRSMKMPLPPQRHPDRKTCTTWIWLYSDEMFTDLPVSIDFVPAVEVSLRYPVTRTRSTWMMTEEKMKMEKKCYFVPKIPNEKSKVTEKLEKQDLHKIGRVSYPTLEVEHIQALEDRVKDVYITAKCMRNVEVCGFKVKNDEGGTRPVSELVTSYRLKSVFLHLAELFIKSDMSLGRMVLMVYEQLEKCLERDHLPMFFDPEINVLAGSKLSTEESLQVTRIMTRFVRSLYERDVSPEQRERDAAEEEKVLEGESVAHADYDERRRKYEKRRDDLIALGEGYEARKLFAPFLPIYLRQSRSNSKQN